jgi:phosphatidylserine/phosphatidylglycerophosphate/cardiolipin synthase-like enzyme
LAWPSSDRLAVLGASGDHSLLARTILSQGSSTGQPLREPAAEAGRLGDAQEVKPRFIDTKHTLFVQNERYQDAVILERLVRAARRGVKIHVLARPPHALEKDKLVEGVGGLRILDDVGIKIHKLKGLKLHGKMLLADGVVAIVGSINLAPGSFDSRRELAIEVRDDEVVERLHKIAKRDWENSHPLDLSDEGLLSDLEDRQKGAAEKLALNEGKKHKKK